MICFNSIVVLFVYIITCLEGHMYIERVCVSKRKLNIRLYCTLYSTNKQGFVQCARHNSLAAYFSVQQGRPVNMNVSAVLLVVSLLVTYSHNFHVVWSVPDQMCIHAAGLNLTDDILRYGFVRNSNNQFRGNRISLIYAPGEFPKLVEPGIGQLEPINGGVPQRGNLQEHLAALQGVIRAQVPDVNFQGLLVLDMEDWRPIFNQNFDSLNKYRTYSRALVLEYHPEWKTKPEKVRAEAERQFEKAARQFMQATVDKVLQMRRNSKIGFYDYPKCFDTADPTKCLQDAIDANNNMSWLFDHNTAIFPSVYLAENSHRAQGRADMVRTRVKEAVRVSKNNGGVPVWPFVTYRYTDTHRELSKKDTKNSLVKSKEAGAEGVVLWGSSNDLKTAEQCLAFRNYVNNVLGPLVLGVTDV